MVLYRIARQVAQGCRLSGGPSNVVNPDQVMDQAAVRRQWWRYRARPRTAGRTRPGEAPRGGADPHSRGSMRRSPTAKFLQSLRGNEPGGGLAHLRAIARGALHLGRSNRRRPSSWRPPTQDVCPFPRGQRRLGLEVAAGGDHVDRALSCRPLAVRHADRDPDAPEHFRGMRNFERVNGWLPRDSRRRGRPPVPHRRRCARRDHGIRDPVWADMHGPRTLRSLFTITGVGIAKWNQLCVFAFPTRRVKNPKRRIDSMVFGSSTLTAVPWTQEARRSSSRRRSRLCRRCRPRAELGAPRRRTPPCRSRYRRSGSIRARDRTRGSRR